MNLFYWKSQPPVGGKHFALYTKNKPVTVRKLVHVKTLHQLEENLRARIFQTVKSSTWSKSTTDKWRRTRIEKNGSDNSKPGDLMELNVLTWQPKSWLKTFCQKCSFSKMTDILWVRFQTKGESTQVCVVILQNWIQEILKYEHGALWWTWRSSQD
jgi:hypothetical protein